MDSLTCFSTLCLFSAVMVGLAVGFAILAIMAEEWAILVFAIFAGLIFSGGCLYSYSRIEVMTRCEKVSLEHVPMEWTIMIYSEVDNG